MCVCVGCVELGSTSDAGFFLKFFFVLDNMEAFGVDFAINIHKKKILLLIYTVS